MESVTLEAPDSQESNGIVTSEAPVSAPEPGAEGQPSTPKDSDVEIDGQRLSAAQIKDAMAALANREAWQKENTRKSQEIAEQRRAWEKEQQEILFLKKKLEEKPDVVQKIFAPEAERNFEAELQELYSRKPQDPFSQEYVQWEFTKDRLNREIAKTEALRESQSVLLRSTAADHNSNVEKSSWEKYRGKVSWEEFRDMAAWVLENVNARGGKYPQNSFDMAYQMVHPEKFQEEIKLSAVKAANDSLTKAKPAGEPGVQKPHDKLTPEEQSDEEFVKRMSYR